MKRIVLCLLTTFSILVTNHAMAQTFSNPIIATDAPDPSVIKADDGMFYLFSTSNRIFKSADMVHWTRIQDCFTPKGRPTFVPGVKNLWAPDINKIGKRYVLYFAISKWGGEDSCGIGVATSKNIEGPYTCINGNGKLFRSFEIGVRNSIDPFYIKDHGKNYLIWGSFHGIYAIQLSKDGLSLMQDSKPFKIAGNAYEGSYIYKHKGYYYFFGSIGSCCAGAKSTYTTVVARSKKLLGPYVDRKGQPLLGNHHEILIRGNSEWAGTGHNGELIKDKKGRTWMPYHAYSIKHPEKGRMVLLDQIKWGEDGWPYADNAEPAATSEQPIF